MLKGVLNKGLVKYSLLLVILVLFLASVFFYMEPGMSAEDDDFITGASVGKGKPAVMDFYEIGEESEDDEDDNEESE